MLYNPLSPFADPFPELESFQLRIDNLRRRYLSERIPPHLLIQGPPGCGKTTLLTALAEAVNDARNLGRNYLPLIIGEEHYPVVSLCTFWEYVAASLAECDPDYAALASEMRHRVELTNRSEDCLELLRYRLSSHNQTLLLFVEQIDRLIRKFSIPEREAFEEILARETCLCLVGTTSQLLDPAPKHMEAFLIHFESAPLRGLDTRDTESLLAMALTAAGKDADALMAARPGLPEFWRRVTGGLPRLIIQAAQVIDPQADDPYLDLMRLMDRVTPDYQSRIDLLPAQQQAIIHVIAQHWDLINAGVVASKLRLPSKLVSAQLGQLYSAGVVCKRRANRKNHLYFLRDRFLNLWYLMRHGNGHDLQRLEHQMRFMLLWYAPPHQARPEPDIHQEAELMSAAKTGRPHGWVRLAHFYQERDRLDEAEKAYQKGVEEGDAQAMTDLAAFTYQTRGSKKIALALARKAAELLRGPEVQYHLMMVSLWNGHVMESVTLFRQLLDEGYGHDHPKAVLAFLLLLGATDQLQVLDRLFWENPDSLRDRFHPVYGALLHLLQERYPRESKRTPPELADMVEGILDAIIDLKQQDLKV